MTNIQKTDNTNADNDGKNRTYYILLVGYKLVTRLWKTKATFEAIYGIYGLSISCTKTFHPDNTKTVWSHTRMYKNVSSHTSRVESTQDPSRDKWVAGLSYTQVNPHTVLLSMKRHERNRHKGISLKTHYICVFPTHYVLEKATLEKQCERSMLTKS